MKVAPPPRLHVIPALACDKALVLRRGPSGQVASLLWDRRSGAVELGQWLNGRIYEHRCDLSPDARHMVIFASTGVKSWTALSRAPWLRAIGFWPQDSTWHGGGAFTLDGRLFLNGAATPDDLPDGLKPADAAAYPHGTDGFHMGALYPAMMRARGWSLVSGDRYEAVLEKPAGDGWTLRLGFALQEQNRSIISNRYALLRDGGAIMEQPDWEWAEPWGAGLQVAAKGCLWFRPVTEAGPGTPDMIRDFGDMRFASIEAPYEGIRE